MDRGVAQIARKDRREPPFECAYLRWLSHAALRRPRNRLPNQGQHQFQRRAHLPCAGAALLRQTLINLSKWERWFCAEQKSRQCRLTKSEGLNFLLKKRRLPSACPHSI